MVLRRQSEQLRDLRRRRWCGQLSELFKILHSSQEIITFQSIVVITRIYYNFKFQNSTFCPKGAFTCFVWISEKAATFVLYNRTNWLFITKMESLYCTILTGPLSNTDLVFVLNTLPLLLTASRAIGQAVSRRPLNKKVRV